MSCKMPARLVHAGIGRQSMINAKEIPWAGHTRACVDGDWLVVLDLRGDRYWALPRPSSPDAMVSALGARGLLATDRFQTQASQAPARHAWRDWVDVIAAAVWADAIVKSGRLDRAFAWIGGNATCASTLSADDVTQLCERFDCMRVWIPHAYVCLFNSLCLIRFMLMRRVKASLVFGVRARPFAAHCWVEASGLILDAGGEDCAAFTEIARV